MLHLHHVGGLRLFTLARMALSQAESKTCATDVRLGIPKGRMHQKLLQLLSEAGIDIAISDRGYRPTINLEGYQVKLLKPQNILVRLRAASSVDMWGLLPCMC